MLNEHSFPYKYLLFIIKDSLIIKERNNTENNIIAMHTHSNDNYCTKLFGRLKVDWIGFI